MEILLGTQGLADSRAYVTVVAEHLERLGHEVTVFSADATDLHAEGLRVVLTGGGLPLAPDVIYVQDAVAALLLADLYPLTPQVFALHDDRAELSLPPQLPAVVSWVAVFDERGRQVARAASLPHKIVRLRRPVDTDRLSPHEPIRDRPRVALLRLEHLSGYRRGVVERACADAGIETEGEPDLTIGQGRHIVEAMAMGLAAYVYGEDGGDGWVSPERYELLEADGFSGRAEPAATDFERLRRDLDAYDPAMGAANRELALAHDAQTHAQQLMELFDSLAPRRDPVDAPLRELARLVRVEAATASRAAAATADANRARAEARRLEQELAEARERNHALEQRVAELEQAAQEAPPPMPERQRGVRRLLAREDKLPSTEG
jgi:hypothetical protein